MPSTTAQPSVENAQRRDWTAFLLCAVMLLLAGLLYALAGDAPQTLAITALGLIVATLLPASGAPSTRSYVYAGVSALAAAVMDVQFFPVESGRFFILPAEVYSPILLYLGVAMLIPARRASSYAAVAAMALIVLTLAGNASSLPPENIRFAWTNALLDSYMALYAAGTGIILVCLALLSPRIVGLELQHPRHWSGRSWVRIALLLVALCAMGGTAAGSRRILRRFEPALGRLLNLLVRHYGDHQPDKVVFGQQVDLWRTLPYRSYQDRTPVIRVLSSIPPGYMRGRAYTRYLNGHWTQEGDPQTLPQRWPEGQHAYTIFTRPLPLPDTPVQLETMVVLPATHHETNVMLTPPAGKRFEMVTDQLQTGLDGAVLHKGWRQESGCRVLTNRHEDAYPLPNSPENSPRRYLQVPAALEQRLHARNRMIGLGGDPSIPDSRRIAETVQYLHQTCSYKLGVGLQSGAADPVVQFLDERRQGHCELFASSAALLLRAQGIPTRYVTGFVCMERAAGRYWLARLRDAHAWMEAYDRQNERWVLVEATPAAGVPSETESPAWLRTLLDFPLTAWQWIRYHVSRGDFAQAVFALIGTALYAIRGFVTTLPGAGLVIAILAAFLWHRIRRRRLHRRNHRDLPFDPELVQIRTRLLRRFRRNGLDRQRGETLGELLRRADQLIPPEQLCELRNMAITYQRLRFCPAQRTEAEVEALLRAVRHPPSRT